MKKKKQKIDVTFRIVNDKSPVFRSVVNKLLKFESSVNGNS